MFRKRKGVATRGNRPVISLLSAVALGTVALVGGSALQAGLSSALPESTPDPGHGGGRTIQPSSTVGVSVIVTGPRTVVSEHSGVLQIAVSAPRQAQLTGGWVDWQSRAAGTSSWRTLETLRLDSAGRAWARVWPWKPTEYRAVTRGHRAVSAGVSVPFYISTRPLAKPVVRPDGAAEPRFSVLTNPARRPRAVGSGAHPVVSRIPGPVWDRMAGVSFDQGCPVGRDDLRYVQVNYWGFDGYRYRGEIVVHASIAQQAAAVFRDLYRLRYPIRQMRLADDFGKDTIKGADDYAAMNADNTSGFNCRYVDGREAQQVLSPHAWGLAIDINTWENPFQARTGVFPNSAYLDRSRTHRAVLSGPNSTVVQVFERRGLRWGGRWAEKDYHHFETPAATRSERR